MSKETILVVDDNPINLKLVQVLLTRNGYDVLIAEDAKKALKVLRKQKPKLILMDIQLPGMDGLELTRKLKADPNFQDIIIIAITAYAMQADEENAFAAGCDGYTTKPININTFPEMVAHYLNISKK